MSPLSKVGVVGTGFVAKGFLAANEDQPDFRVSKILTRRTISECKDIPLPELLTNSVEELIDSCDLVLECSGDIFHATHVVDEAFKADKPVVTLNAEFHVTTGSYFTERGILTEAEGDQPGCQAALFENALTMGFRPRVLGNVKGFHNPDPSLEDMQYWSAKQGISLKMVTAATDGTKLQFEQALVANGFQAGIIQDGLTGENTDDLYSSGIKLAEMAKERGTLIADYVVAPKSSSRVFVVAEHDPRQAAALEYLKLGPGPFYLLPQPIMLVHLEVAKTIRRILSGGEPLLNNSSSPTISVAAVAKRDLKSKEVIAQGIGSFDVRGIAVKMREHPGHVPIGVLRNGVLRNPVEKGQMLTFSDIDLPDNTVIKVWQDIEERAINQ